MAAKLAACVSAVSNWCAAKRLQLDTNKTEVTWMGSATNFGKLSSAEQHLKVEPDNVSPTTVVRDLGVFFDSELTMKSHISRITSACFYQLRRLRTVRGQLGQEVTDRLVLVFILSRLDYCNAILAGLPTSTLASLQRVIHAAVRVVYDFKPYDHVTPALKALHWLPIKQRIEFRLCILVHLAINNKAPVYLQNLLTTTASVSLVGHQTARPATTAALKHGHF